MNKLIEHLGRTVERQFADSSDPRRQKFIDGFRSGALETRIGYAFSLPYPVRAILNAMLRVLKQQKFDPGQGVHYDNGTLTARMEGDASFAGGWLGEQIRQSADTLLSFAVHIEVKEGGEVIVTCNRPLQTWVEEFKELTLNILEKTSKRVLDRERFVSGLQDLENPLLPPGKPLDRPFRGILRDYSGCATQGEVSDLSQGHGGVLPLGKQAFGVKEQGNISYGDMLYLSPLVYSENKAQKRVLREHSGALICATQNSGKTELIVRWARAANQAGYNLFLVDVKGNLYEKLVRDGWRGEKPYLLSTDPRRSPDKSIPGAGHRLNLLDGIDGGTSLGAVRIRQLASALLPVEKIGAGENFVYYANWLNWLIAFVHLVLLDHSYHPFEGRNPDLSDVYDLAKSEDELMECIRRIDAGEVMRRHENLPLHQPTLDELVVDIAVLLPPAKLQRIDRTVPAFKGQRSEHSYRWLTESLVSALHSFKRGGPLYEKVSGIEERQFRLEWLAGYDSEGKPRPEQVTVVVAARLQEEQDARVLLSAVMTKLEHALYNRFTDEYPGQRPVLMLLDETRRIKNFKANDYITYAREARAGCVLVYQSLDQIGNEGQIKELIENVGIQIYLDSLVGNTAKYFIESLPKRFSPRYSRSSSVGGGEGGTETLQTGQEMVDYFTTADLYRLPAGRFPGLIYIKDQPRRSPILVTMDRDITGV